MQSGHLALANYGEVPLCWRTRLLLAEVDAAANTWLILTPDLDRYDERLDLRNPDFVDFAYLGASDVPPARIPAASIYGFSDMSPGDIAYQMAQGQLEANALRLQRGLGPRAPAVVPPPAPVVPPAPPLPAGVLGPAPAPPAPIAPAVAVPAQVNTFVWVALESTGGRTRGDIVCIEPAALPGGHVMLDDKAIVPDLQGGPNGCCVKRVSQLDANSYKLEDLRVLPVTFDIQGIRRREFANAVPLMIEATPQGGGLQLEGPPTALNIAKGLREQSMTPTSYHEFWIRSADIPRGDRSVYEHECLSRIFESMICVDQLNPSGLQSMELVVRRMQVIREAHRVSPSAPDYSSADYFMGWRYRKQNQGIDSGLAAHVASELKNDAAIQKESRKAREEQFQRRQKPGKTKESGGGGETK